MLWSSPVDTSPVRYERASAKSCNDVSLTSRCRTPNSESGDALFTDRLCLAPEIVPIFELRRSVVPPFKHADLNITGPFANQLG